MTRRRISPFVRKWAKDSLVDEELDEKFDTIAPRFAKFRWRRRHYDKAHILYTPYGNLEVCKTFGGYTVRRDKAPLVHARCPSEGLLPEAIFTHQRGAKAAGLIHAMDGFGEIPPDEDGLWWRISGPAIEITAPQLPGDLMDDHSLPDDHEWGGRKRLDQLLKNSGVDGSAADESLVLEIEAFASWWAVPPPQWSSQAVGRFELKTPYGILVVRRMIGWMVERNGVPLCWWFMRDPRVILDNLEHAKTIALACARGNGALPIGFVRWGKRDHQQAVTPLQPLSAA